MNTLELYVYLWPVGALILAAFGAWWTLRH